MNPVNHDNETSAQPIQVKGPVRGATSEAGVDVDSRPPLDAARSGMLASDGHGHRLVLIP